MSAFGIVVPPDARIIARLLHALRSAPSSGVFIASGKALAAALLVERGGGTGPAWADALADAMTGALVLVQYRSASEEDDSVLVELSAAASALAVARPELWRRCEGAIHDWMGRIASVDRREGEHDLAVQTLLWLLIDDVERACEAVDALVERPETQHGWLLHDWAVSRLQQQGCARESVAFHNLRVSLAHGLPGGAAASLLILAGLVMARRAERGPCEVLTWFDAVAAEVRTTGTSSRAMSA